MITNLNISIDKIPHVLIRLLLIVLFSNAYLSKATHIVGGELFYTYQPGNASNSYSITLIVYRDCGPDNTNGVGFDESATIGIFNSDGFLVTDLQMALSDATVTDVPVSLENPCFTLPPDLCIEQCVYNGVVSLTPIPGGYDLVYQRCCRNNSIINIQTPAESGMTMWAQIPGSVNGENNSAIFNNTPPVAMCLGGEFFFDHSATDIDGDVLSYELCTPFFGASPETPEPNTPDAPDFIPLQWGNGYSNDVQMIADPDFEIDSETGQITGTPSQIGKYAVGICVKEYRNGQLISQTMRDFQYQVTNCDPTIIAAIPSQNQFCDGLSFQFNNESFNASSFFWNFGDPSTNSDTSSVESPFYTYSEEGEYEVTLIANPGWPCADTTYTSYEAYPPVTAEIDDVVFECANGTPQYTFIGSEDYEPTAELEWRFPSAFDVSQTNEPELMQEAPQPGSYEITYTVEDNGCIDEEPFTLEVPPPPEAVLVSQTLFCNGFTFEFENNSQNASDYDWDFGLLGQVNDVSSLFEPSYTYPDSGSYTVTLYARAPNTCPHSTTSTYHIQGLLDPFFPAPDSQCFDDHSFDFIASGFDSQDPTFDWDFGLQATPTGSDEISINGVTWEEPGIYSVALAISENNCTKVWTQNVEIVPNPIPGYHLFEDEGCPPLSVTFYNDSEAEVPLSYLWDFGDGKTSTETNPTHSYGAPGIYDVTLTISSSSGCTDIVTIAYDDIVNVYPSPIAGFEADLYSVTYLEPTINITDLSSGGTSCYYDFGDGTFSQDCDPTHDFENVGFLDVTQTIYNNFGCFDTYTIPFSVTGHLFYAPNSFSPNNDGLNESFKPFVVGVTKYSFRIYDRWGEAIFETSDPDKGWNGSVKEGSHYAANGVYSYQIIVHDLTGYPHEYYGHVSVMR